MEILAELEALIADASWFAAFVAIVVATLVSEDLTCIACGLLVARGDMGLGMALGGCVFGLWFGDLTLYGWGHFVGKPAIRRRPFRWWFTQEDVDKCAAWYEQRGSVVIYLARIVPGCRLPTYFAAGLLSANFLRFNLHCFIACALWVPLLVGLAVIVGDGVLRSFEIVNDHKLLVFVGLLVTVYLVIKIVIPLFTYRGRRLLRGSIRRKTRWEYWPAWFFYVPIIGYILWLAVRHRGLTLFTTVNPAIFAGGFVNESKSEILDGLTADPANDEFVCAFRKIAPSSATDDRVATLEEFLETRGLEYPVVLKPDAGQRGSGVAVVRSTEEAREYLADTPIDVIAQEFAPGEEFGIFYYREPGEAAGRIFSITEKRFPEVEGDGHRTLEQLVLADDDLLPMARLYLDKLGSRTLEVPARGERVRLVEIGNHCRGAVFLDGAWVKTDALERRIDEISRRYDGFDFGRYDLRTPSVDDLREGRNFKIVELNGATSEATHIYDPRNSVLTAYRTLFEQWRILFRIAASNRARGIATVPASRLARLALQYRQASKSHPV